jgi:hypothetical protein
MNKPLAPAPPKPPPAKTNGNGKPAVEARPVSSFGIAKGTQKKAAKVIIYGPGGVGKSELCSLIKAVGVEPLFLDIEEGSAHLDVSRLDPAPANWDELRAVLHSDVPSAFGAIVVDSLTKAEELSIAWTIANVKHEKGHYVTGIEQYGFGKGISHNYETFLQLLGDLDSWARRGKHILCVAHDCTANVPNPAGEDWIRYEPRLQSPPSGKGSVRHRCKEWCDHLLYVGFDTFVNNEGKASGSGTRTIYPAELPTHWAKSRSLSEPIPYIQGDATLWQQLLGDNS